MHRRPKCDRNQGLRGYFGVYKIYLSLSGNVTFQGFMATRRMMAVFWVVAPHRLAESDRHFKGTYCLHPQRLTGIYI
jgi:hypothetical protein